MEQLPKFGTEISEILEPTFAVYAKLLLANAKAIHSTTKKTFKYGPLDRHTLDIYYPSKQDSTKPVFIFLHGGGLVAGARILGENEVPDGLAYANVGHFFAETYGFTVVIPNYRLIKHGAKFPSGGEDVSFVVEWLQQHPKELGSGDVPRDLFTMGHSAGGIHLSTYLFGPMFAKQRESVLSQSSSGHLELRGVIFLGTVFSLENSGDKRPDMIRTYWGDRSAEESPTGLLRSLLESTRPSKVLPGVKFLALEAEFDSVSEVIRPYEELKAIWEQSADVNDLHIETIAGHNHLSPSLGVGTGIPVEEAWAHMVGVYVNTVRAFVK